MPTFEGTCESENCQLHGETFEYFLRKWTDPDKDCPGCNFRVKRLMSAPMISWAKPMGQYCGENTEGHYATARNPETQEVEKTFIRTRQDQKEFCKRNGYYDPTDIPTSVTAGDDGKLTNTTGSKGSWI